MEQPKLLEDKEVYQIISSFYPLIGGAERATQTLCCGLVAAGCKVEVITAWHPGLSRQQVVGDLSVRRFGWSGPGKVRSFTFGLASLMHILRRQRAVPLIHAQNIDTPLLVGLLVRIIARKRLILTVHSDQVIPQKSRTIPGRLRIALMRRWVDHFIAVSQSGRQCMLDVGISPERISLIPNGLDTDFFRPPTCEEKAALRAELGYKPEDVIVLFLGRLIPSKRADLLLIALHKLSEEHNVKCIVAGDGSENEELQTLAQELALRERVRFVGAVNNVRDFYWLSDVFVQPSQFEGLSVALLESMACGLAVVVSDCEGNLELVTDRVNGLTFPVDNAQQLTERLTELIENPALRTVLGKRASADISARYSKEVVAEAHLEVYRQVLGIRSLTS